MDLLLLLMGLVGLWVGTEIAVNSAIRIADHFGWSHWFVGMTLLAFGTDLPETIVAIRGSINNLKGIENSGFIVGNAIGSSLAQIGLVAGIIAIFSTILLGKHKLSLLAIQLTGSVLILFLAIADGSVGRMEGGVMLFFFGLYLYLLFDQQPKSETNRKGSKVWARFLIVAAGLGLVVLSAELVLAKAISFSEEFGIRQSFVGAIIIGLGTSLPELGISLNAALKRKSGLSLGNLVGSNIYDCLIPIGIAACIAPLTVEASMIWIDTPFLILLTIVFLLFLRFKSRLSRIEGVVLVVLFLVYVSVKFSMAN